MAATIASKLYVTIQYRKDAGNDDGHLGFASPYTKDAAFQKRKSTQDSWAYGGGTTIEIDSLSASDARQRFLENYPQLPIKLIQGDSAEEIMKLLKTIDSNQNSVLAYLDAHWLDAIPTALEIEALGNWNGPWVAVIDDFYNPNDASYGFDKYGEIVIGAELLPEIHGMEIWVSNLPSTQESGARRGTGYVFNEKALVQMKNFSFEALTRIR